MSLSDGIGSFVNGSNRSRTRLLLPTGAGKTRVALAQAALHGLGLRPLQASAPAPDTHAGGLREAVENTRARVSTQQAPLTAVVERLDEHGKSINVEVIPRKRS